MGPAAPYLYGAPFFDAAIRSALAATVAASASGGYPGVATVPPTAATVRAETALARENILGIRICADITRHPS
ncbi:hypothetical protein GCM10009548_29270 [Streptomyces malaysiensis subsp. malaysiensis]